MGSMIHTAVREIDPKQPIYSLQTLEQMRGAALAQPRETAALVVAFGIVSLLITAGGLSGVVAYSVNQRVSEIGIRVALGASRTNILSLVSRGAFSIVLIGVALGVFVSVAFARLIQGLLYGVVPVDPMTFVVAAIALLGIAAIACFIPARRALLIEPLEALRTR